MGEKNIIKYNYRDKLNQNVLKNILIENIPILKNIKFSFVEVNKINSLLNDIYNKIDFISKDTKNLLLIKDCDDVNLEISCKEIMKLKEKFYKYKDFVKWIFFIKFKGEFYAIEINIDIIFDNIDYFFEISGFKKGYSDFLFVSEDLLYGICIERYEYHNILVRWV